MFQVNADFLINQLTKYFYTRHLTLPPYFTKKFALSIAESFKNIHFLPHFYQFSEWMNCTMFQIKTNFQTGQQNIYYFKQKTLHTIKISVFHRRGSRQHSLFIIFSLVLRMGKVFNITNKYQCLISQLKAYIFTKETLHIYVTCLHIGVFRTLLNI